MCRPLTKHHSVSGLEVYIDLTWGLRESLANRYFTTRELWFTCFSLAVSIIHNRYHGNTYNFPSVYSSHWGRVSHYTHVQDLYQTWDLGSNANPILRLLGVTSNRKTWTTLLSSLGIWCRVIWQKNIDIYAHWRWKELISQKRWPLAFKLQGVRS